MDLQYQHKPDLCALLINTYFEHTQDYTGLTLLKFYQCYRAMVRAKIASFQIQQTLAAEDNLIALQNYISLAHAYTLPSHPTLTITFGLSGSGKTVYTQKLLVETGAIRLRSDIVRTTLSAQNTNKYNIETTKAVYHKLAEIAEMLLETGYSVIIDATNLKRWQREIFSKIAQRLQIPFQMISFDVPIEVLRERITQRLQSANDASEATIDVLEMQLKELEPLTDIEKSCTKESTTSF